MISTLLGVGALVLAIGAVVLFVPTGAGPGDESVASSTAPAQDRVQDPVVPQPVDLATLPESTTHTTVGTAQLDSGSLIPTDGVVVHPRQEVAVFQAPGGPPIARIGPRQVGDTWLPVIAEQPGWVRVLLPSRPNGSTGWLVSEGLDQARTPYLIRIHLRSFSMELLRNGRLLGEWTIGIGKRSAPTPTGRTFLLGSFSDRNQTYSPVILPLGAHSPTLDRFGGGPGTVAIHTWPTDDVFGTRSSDGCIRVPPDALEQLTEVPLGTLVLIDEE